MKNIHIPRCPMRKHPDLLSRLLLLTVGVSAVTSAAFSLSVLYGMPLLSNLTSVGGGENGTTILTNTVGDPTGITAEESARRTNEAMQNRNSGDDDEEEEDDDDEDNEDNEDDTTSGSGSGDCILRISQCPPTQATCLESITFQRVTCGDEKCSEDFNSCLPMTSNSVTGATGTTTTNTTQTSNEESNSGRLHVDQSDTTTPDIPVDRNSGTAPDTSTAVSLGCFTKDGAWTRDRASCDPDQKRHLDGTTEQRPSATGPFLQEPSATPKQETGITSTTSPTAAHAEVEADRQDVQLQKGLEELFHMNNERSAARTNLLEATVSAVQRLESLKNSSLPDEAKTLLTETQSWIGQLGTDVASTPDMPLDVVLAKAGELKGRLQDTMQAVATVTQVTPQKRPETVIQKMDRLFATLPTVFLYLQDQGAPLSLEASNAYQTAGGLYSTAKPSCIADADECKQLTEVLNRLGTMRDEISQTLARLGKSDLEQRVEEMLR